MGRFEAENALLPNNVIWLTGEVETVYVASSGRVMRFPSCFTSDILRVSLTQSRACVGGGTVWRSLKHLCPQTRLAKVMGLASSRGTGYL